MQVEHIETGVILFDQRRSFGKYELNGGTQIRLDVVYTFYCSNIFMFDINLLSAFLIYV